MAEKDEFGLDRRKFLAYFSSIGLGGTLLPGVLWGQAQQQAAAAGAVQFYPEMVGLAARVADVPLSADAQKRIAENLNRRGGHLASYEQLRAMKLGNDTPPAYVFNPVLPGMKIPAGRKVFKYSQPRVAKPKTDEDLAFLPVTHLARLIETRQVTPSELTKLYLSRLRRYDPQLQCVVSLTEDLALRQARQADEEIPAGRYRGPLHGIPWGLKDLFAVRGTRTTWGMTPYRDRVIDKDSTVYTRLTEAGAILVAKLSTGALAVSARWFGGLTRCPWDTSVDAAGSSGGPGAATAAGRVGFAIGTDTGGSVIGPSSRNGISGLRPTFGRVSRDGGMVLAAAAAG